MIHQHSSSCQEAQMVTAALQESSIKQWSGACQICRRSPGSTCLLEGLTLQRTFCAVMQPRARYNPLETLAIHFTNTIFFFRTVQTCTKQSVQAKPTFVKACSMKACSARSQASMAGAGCRDSWIWCFWTGGNGSCPSRKRRIDHPDHKTS